MIEITEKAWKSFHATFKDGDEVVVEDRTGMFHWGKLTARETVISLTRPGGWSKDILWADVEFVCHDGFPVRHIFGMSPKEAQRRADQTPRKVIHDYLDDIVKPIGGGCPWIAEGRLVEILNKGSTTEDETCETIILANGDARFHSYWTGHLFLDF